MVADLAQCFSHCGIVPLVGSQLIQRDLLVHCVLTAEDPGPAVTLTLLILLGKEVGHQVVVVAVTSLAALNNWEDTLHGALLLRDIDCLHVQNKFNYDNDLAACHPD